MALPVLDNHLSIVNGFSPCKQLFKTCLENISGRMLFVPPLFWCWTMYNVTIVFFTIIDVWHFNYVTFIRLLSVPYKYFKYIYIISLKTYTLVFYICNAASSVGKFHVSALRKPVWESCLLHPQISVSRQSRYLNMNINININICIYIYIHLVSLNPACRLQNSYVED